MLILSGGGEALVFVETVELKNTSAVKLHILYLMKINKITNVNAGL